MSKKRGCFYFALIGFALLLVAILINLPYGNMGGNGWVISPETTVLTGPIREDGSVDFAKAINKRNLDNLPKENNLAAQLFRIVPEGDFQSNENLDFNKQLAVAFGYTALPDPIPYPDTTEAMKEVRAKEQVDSEIQHEMTNQFMNEFDLLMTKPWTNDSYPEWAIVIARQKRALDFAVEKASTCTGSFHPLVLLSAGRNELILSCKIPIVQSFRRVARDLSRRAMLSIGEGNIEQALLDIKTIRRIGVAGSGTGTMIEKLVGIGILTIAQNAEEQLLNWGGLSENQLQDLKNFISSNRCKIDTPSRVDQMGRLMTIDAIQAIKFQGYSFPAHMAQPTATQKILDVVVSSSNLNEAMKTANKIYDRFQSLTPGMSLVKLRQKATEIDDEIEALEIEYGNLNALFWRSLKGSSHRGKMVGEIVALMSIPGVRQVIDSEIRCILNDELIIAACSIQQFRLENNRFPANLAELKPSIVDSLPIDPLNEREFSYVLTPDGCIVYSFGLDGQDNSGLTYEESSDFNNSDFRVCFGSPPPAENGSPQSIKQREYELKQNTKKRIRPEMFLPNNR